MANEPTAYPSPLARPGGPGYRTLRNVIGIDVRQPDLGGPPRIASLSGFGAGASAGVINGGGSQADRSQGAVTIRCGANPSASGGLVLEFSPIVPGAGQYVALAPWAVVTVGVAGTQITCSWTANKVLRPFESLHLAYQWAVST